MTRRFQHAKMGFHIFLTVRYIHNYTLTTHFSEAAAVASAPNEIDYWGAIVLVRLQQGVIHD
jgi:hypothetical protein